MELRIKRSNLWKIRKIAKLKGTIRLQTRKNKLLNLVLLRAIIKLKVVSISRTQNLLFTIKEILTLIILDQQSVNN